MRTSIREHSHRLPDDYYRGHVCIAFDACLRDGGAGLSEPGVVRECVSIMRAAFTQYACVAPAYCFMPDHLHIVVRGTQPSSDVLSAMKLFKQRSGFWFSGRRPTLRWQKDFYDRTLHSDSEIVDRVWYVFGNPVRRGLVEHWWDYPASGTIGVALEDVVGAVPEGCMVNAYGPERQSAG